jgi:hypothetical protein
MSKDELFDEIQPDDLDDPNSKPRARGKGPPQ